MLKLFLARHGQDEDNAHGILNGRRDQPLTEKGLAQAQEIAAKIKDSGIPFDAIYTSPLQRASRTAQEIAHAIHAAEPIVLPELIERDFGVMSGQPQSTIVESCAPDILQAEKITYFLSPPGAETFPQLLERAHGLLTHLQEKHPDGNVLLVTHGDFGKMIYASYYHLDWKDVLLLFHFGNSELLELSPESSAEETHVFRIEQHNS